MQKNEEETARWTRYSAENGDLEKNLKHYTKHLEVDVMVPIGSKALMPGKLYHTNEILVFHGSQVFSKCSADQAIEISKRRQTLALDFLKKLGTERDLFR